MNLKYNKKILVTGAAGFIGFHLSRKLIKNKINIIGVDNINDYYDVNLKKSRLSELEKESKKNGKTILHYQETLLGFLLDSIHLLNTLYLIILLLSQSSS